MKKIPTLFKRNPEDMRYVLIEVHPDCQWVLDGEGVARRKHDGICVLIRRDGLAVHAFTRQQVKDGNLAPEDFTEVGYDEATGKRQGWIPADLEAREHRRLREAVENAGHSLTPGTYELCGPKVNKNPEALRAHTLIRHDDAEVCEQLTRPTLLDYGWTAYCVTGLGEAGWEGIVWHHPDGRMAKLKARDFPPPAILVAPKPMDDRDVQALKERWAERKREARADPEQSPDAG